ncbi:MAG: hypothetical protein WKF37_06285 [Bryobacteraceae bacterium]
MVFLTLPSSHALFAGNYPSASIGNGQIEARLFLPDAARGFYRGTRFDWAGIVASLKWRGHEFFGQWYARHDPLIHDAITGPVDIFDTHGAGLGYAEAAAGEGFIRIGVGVVEKPEEPAYRGTQTYKILDTGKRTTQRIKRVFNSARISPARTATAILTARGSA